VDIPNGQVKFCFLLNLKMGPKWPFAMVVKMQPNSHPSGQMAVWREMAIWASQMAISMATEQALIRSYSVVPVRRTGVNRILF